MATDPTLLRIGEGEISRAREHLQRAEATIGALGNDEYGQLIRDGLQRLTEQLR